MLHKVLSDSRPMKREDRARHIQQALNLALTYNDVGRRYLHPPENPEDDEEEESFQYNCAALVLSPQNGRPYWLDGTRKGPIQVSDNKVSDTMEDMVVYMQDFIQRRQEETDKKVFVMAFTETPKPST